MKFHKDHTLPVWGEIFVFGSNLAGIHGAGAAGIAHKHYGAKYGYHVGFIGRCYAIPTRDSKIITLPLSEIKTYIDSFVLTTKTRNDLEFFITRVGCGLAGYEDKDIAPLFKDCGSNCSFANTWEKYLQ
jgi:hypothetical protein